MVGKNSFIPLCKAGYPFVISALVLTLIAISLGYLWPTLVFGVVLAFFVLFFRDPKRVIPAEPGALVAPADGRIVEVEEVNECEYLGGKARKISVFMNLFNVHVNRMPVAARVIRVIRQPGGFMPADRKQASRKNSRVLLLLETNEGQRLLVVQVAGLVARRIICYARAGDFLEKGQRFGVILFGSRVDVYLPLDFQPRVGPGTVTRAGVTIIGEMGVEAERKSQAGKG